MRDEIKNAVIFNLSANPLLAKNIAKKSGIEHGKVDLKKFADGEMFVEVKSTVRNKHVFIVQSSSNPSSTHIMEILLLTDALKRASVKEINLVIPYFGYARQDRRSKGRQPISSKLVADLYEVAGINRIITFDLHASQIEGFFNIPVDNLKASGILLKTFKKGFDGKASELVVVSPDHGGVTRARDFAKNIKAPLAVIDKRRTGTNKAEAQFILGDVKGKKAIIVDDIIDTAGTIKTAVELLYKEGAKKVYVVATHPVLSSLEDKAKVNTALLRLKEAKVSAFITTNSIEKGLPKTSLIKTADLSKPIADVLVAHLQGKSITKYFIKKYKVEL